MIYWGNVPCKVVIYGGGASGTTFTFRFEKTHPTKKEQNDFLENRPTDTIYSAQSLT